MQQLEVAIGGINAAQASARMSSAAGEHADRPIAYIPSGLSSRLMTAGAGGRNWRSPGLNPAPSMSSTLRLGRNKRVMKRGSSNGASTRTMTPWRSCSQTQVRWPAQPTNTTTATAPATVPTVRRERGRLAAVRCCPSGSLSAPTMAACSSNVGGWEYA